MNGSIPEAEQELGKVQFQEELNKWFESRGIIADLRSHLRHLMITALQNRQIGLRPSEKTSPKAQALNLIVADYLLRHRCHYTLSVFTSEVPTLSNFCTGGLLDPKRDHGFQEKEVDEIFNVLGLSSGVEELEHAKSTYLQKNNEFSLMELMLQTNFKLSAKLQVRESLESYEVEEGKKLLSKKWLTKIVDVLLSKNIKPSQVAVIELAIYRITEAEVNRIIEDERRLQMEILAKRESRIQDYLRRHEDEIVVRVAEAEKAFTTRADKIDKELCERQRRLCKLALDWNNKHEEIVKLSRNFCDIEKENRELHNVVDELEAENKRLGEQREKQNETIDELRSEISSLIERLKEVSESNAVLGERLEALISRENKEVAFCHEEATQEKPVEEKTQLFWSKNKSFESPSEEKTNKEEIENQETAVKVNYYENWNIAKLSESSKNNFDDGEKPKEILNLNPSDDENDASLPRLSSSEEVLLNARKKLQDLEKESERINQNYLDYKLKRHSSESENSADESRKILEPVQKSPQDNYIPLKDSKFSQTRKENKFVSSVQKPDEIIKSETVASLSKISKKTSEEELPRVTVKEPTKRQLENREFFLKSRQLLQELEKQNVEELQATSSSNVEVTDTSSSGDLSSRESTKKVNSKKDFVLLTPLRTTSFYCNDAFEAGRTSSLESVRKSGAKSSSSLMKVDLNCLALLEETRIKSPPEELRKKSLRQQMLLSGSDEEEEEKNEETKIKELKSPKGETNSFESVSSGKLSVGKENGDNYDFL